MKIFSIINYHESYSFSFFLITLIILLSFLAGIFEICDYDFWYHLASGKLIIENRGSPQSDPFYYTLQNEPFITDYWLFQIILYFIYSIFNIKGVIIFQSFCFATTIIILIQLGKLITKSNLLIIPILLAVIVEARGRFVPRPELFMMIFAASYIYIINAYLIKKKNYLFFIPLIQIIWVNSHPSFIFGLVILFFHIIGMLINNLILIKPKKIIDEKIKILLLILIISLALSFLCPNPLQKLKLPFSFFYETRNELLLQVIQELQGYKLKYDIFTLYSFLLFFSGLTFILKIKDIDFSDLLLFLFFAYLSLTAVRFVPLFMLAVALVLFKNLEHIQKNYLSNIKILSSKYLKGTANILLIPAIFYTGYITIGFNVAPTSDYIFGFGISKTKFPSKLIEFLEANKIEGKMLNPLHYGGYLEWKLFPKQKVFIDGRMLGRTNFRNEYFMLHYHKKNWDSADKKYDFDYLIVEYPSKDPNDQLVSFLAHNDNYKILYFDDKNILYLKNKQKFKNLIDKYSYNYISPFSIVMERMAQNFYTNPQIKEEAKKEIFRLLFFNPDISKAHHYLGNIYFMEKKYKEAFQEYSRALSIDPLISSLRHNIGLIYLKDGNYQKAIEAFQGELSLFPDSISTRLLLARTYFQIKNYDKAKEACYYILRKDPNNEKALELLRQIGNY